MDVPHLCTTANTVIRNCAVDNTTLFLKQHSFINTREVAVFDMKHQLITGVSDDFLLHKIICVLKNQMSSSTRMKIQGCCSNKYTSWSNFNSSNHTYVF